MNNQPQSGPPNLDDLFANWHRRVFGPKQKGGASPAPGLGLALIVLLVLWILSGIVLVAPAQRAVVLRLGQYNRTLDPGPHWIPRLFETSKTINVQRISTFSYQAEMLTKDENIVFVSLSVQYRIQDPKQYLYQVVDPENSIKQVTASALRQVVGHTSLDDILTKGRAQARDLVEQQIKRVLAQYNTGIEVVDVNLQPAKPPEQVTAAFDDAIKAREDEQRYINQAKAYSEQVVPKAQGKASRVLQEAEAQRQRLVLEAQADVAGFYAMLPEYRRGPAVLKRRMYLDTMKQTVAHVPKIFVDASASNPLLYLPLDQLMRGTRDAGNAADAHAAQDANQSADWAGVRRSLHSAYVQGGYHAG
jgi:membrane protease subunit HflK